MSLWCIWKCFSGQFGTKRERQTWRWRRLTLTDCSFVVVFFLSAGNGETFFLTLPRTFVWWHCACCAHTIEKAHHQQMKYKEEELSSISVALLMISANANEPPQSSRGHPWHQETRDPCSGKLIKSPLHLNSSLVQAKTDRYSPIERWTGEKKNLNVKKKTKWHSPEKHVN